MDSLDDAARLHGDFGPIRDALAPAEWSAPERTTLPPRSQASVAVILRATPSPELLLVRRSLSEKDPWSGHMALPGGRREVEDETGLHTAIRETHEECGLILPTAAGLGQLAPVSPQSLKLPTLRVTPYVFGVEHGAQAHVASPEIDAVFWVSMDELRDPDNHRIVAIPLIGSVRDFPAYTVAGQTVWGMTYRVLTRFLEHYDRIA